MLIIFSILVRLLLTDILSLEVNPTTLLVRYALACDKPAVINNALNDVYVFAPCKYVNPL